MEYTTVLLHHRRFHLTFAFVIVATHIYVQRADFPLHVPWFRDPKCKFLRHAGVRVAHFNGRSPVTRSEQPLQLRLPMSPCGTLLFKIARLWEVCYTVS